MTDLGTLESPKSADMSTVLGKPSEAEPSGGGAPKVDPEPKSLRDTISEVVKAGNEDPKAEPEVEAKAEAEADKEADDKSDKKAPKDDGKADKEPSSKEPADKEPEGKDPADEDADDATADKEKPDAADKDEPVRKKPSDDAPKKFMPDAKEKWANVPNVVKRDINNMLREHEEQTAKTAKATERYENIRDFDELAQANGRDLRDSLMRVHHIENELASNPVSALNRILIEAGPRKPDGQPVSLFEVAQYIVQQGHQGYQQMVAQQPQAQQQPQANPEVEQLKQQVAQMQQQQLATSIIDPFRAANPRYDELKEDIAFFLKSGKIPAGYSPSERLEAAYDMAARINPASNIKEDDIPESPAAESFAGSKSIKSAPGAVSNTMELERGGSIRDVLERERKRIRRS